MVVVSVWRPTRELLLMSLFFRLAFFPDFCLLSARGPLVIRGEDKGDISSANVRQKFAEQLGLRGGRAFTCATRTRSELFLARAARVALWLEEACWAGREGGHFNLLDTHTRIGVGRTSFPHSEKTITKTIGTDRTTVKNRERTNKSKIRQTGHPTSHKQTNKQTSKPQQKTGERVHSHWVDEPYHKRRS